MRTYIHTSLLDKRNTGMPGKSRRQVHHHRKGMIQEIKKKTNVFTFSKFDVSIG